MKREEIKSFVTEFIAGTENCNLDPLNIKESALLKDDLGLDSLDFIELVMKIEKEYNIGLPDEEASGRENDTVRDFVDYVQSKIE